MTHDHGHPVRLGVLLDPSRLAPDALTALARLADDAGLDVLAVTDPTATRGADDAALDAWTTLSWVAGATHRITLTTHRLASTGPAAVLARAAAGLDRATGGRLELGLTALAAGAHPSPALGVQPDAGAVAEVLAVLRAMWADAGTVRAAGPAHRVPGTPAGPAPAHDVPVWLGGGGADLEGGAALLDLAGRSADGWWTDTAGPDVAAALHGAGARLADAARRAGREPVELRHLVTVTELPDVALLVRLVVDEGVDTVLLAATDAAAIRHLAADVAPEVRARVAAERATRGTRPAPARSARVRAARREGIDYDGVPAGLETVEPGDARYAAMRSTYLRGGRPGLVLLPRDTAEVSRALTWARTQPVALAVRSGGHGISGRSTNDGGIVLDLRHLDTVEVLDTATRRVRVGPGARWGEVAEALEPHGWAITSGDYGGVGVGGLATAGGLGFLAREHGLTIDHVRAAEVVLADGSVVRTDAEHHPDLFWGLRGAGGNLGIVTSFELEADVVGKVGFAQLAFAVDDLASYLRDFGTLVEAAPRDLTPFLILGRPQGERVVAQILAVVDSDDPDTIIDRLQPFAALAPLVQQSVRLLPYSGVVQRAEDVHRAEGEPVTRSGMIEHLTPAFAEDAERLVRSGDVFFFQIRSAGGAVNDVPGDATAYAHRTASFQVVALGASRDRLDRRWDALSHHFSGIYSSFETDTRPDRLAEIYPEPTLSRLRAVKERYDPDDVFRHNHSVGRALATVPSPTGGDARPGMLGGDGGI